MDNPEANIPTPIVQEPASALAQAPEKKFVLPATGEVITCNLTQNTYTMGDRIGEGAFGVVYSCTDVWGNALAVKVLKPIGSQYTYEKIKASAQAELTKLLTLRHPNITYVFDAFEYRDTFYIVTERCAGPVSDLFKLEGFDGKPWVMPIARCLCQAIQYLHLNKLVHQDIHSGNVFATFVKNEMPPNEKVLQFRLADLGVAKLFNEVDGSNTRNQSILPPEVLRPQEFGPLDFHIDLYHVALLLLQIALSKEITFTHEEILTGKPRELAEALPPPLNFALGKALRRHAPNRTSSAMELWRDLKSLPVVSPNITLVQPST